MKKLALAMATILLSSTAALAASDTSETFIPSTKGVRVSSNLSLDDKRLECTFVKSSTAGEEERVTFYKLRKKKSNLNPIAFTVVVKDKKNYINVNAQVEGSSYIPRITTSVEELILPDDNDRTETIQFSIGKSLYNVKCEVFVGNDD